MIAFPESMLPPLRTRLPRGGNTAGGEHKEDSVRVKGVPVWDLAQLSVLGFEGNEHSHQ